MSQKELAVKAGTTQQQIQKLENRSGLLNGYWLNKTAEALGINPEDIQNTPDEEQEAGGLVSIDVVDALACCGDGCENFSEKVIGKQMMTLAALHQLTLSAPENIKILRVIGDSMQPTINPDDTVWVDISFTNPTSDGLYLIRIGSDLMVKRIQIHPLDNTATISSDNPKYAPIPAGYFRDVVVLGKVIYHIKKVG